MSNPKRRVETRGELIGERLVVNEVICVGRADRIFVKVRGIALAAFDTCNLSAHQRSPVFEILRAMPRPKFELPATGDKSLEMLLFFVRRCGIPCCRVAERTIEAILRRFKM